MSDRKYGNADEYRLKGPMQHDGVPRPGLKVEAQSKQHDTIPYIIESACPMGGLLQQTFICHAPHSR